MLRVRSYVVGRRFLSRLPFIPPFACVAVAAALAGSPAALYAQSRATTAELTGTVRDTSNAVLPAATVTATSVDKNIARTATSDAAGHYAIAGLSPGVYIVKAELTGFASQERQGVTLQLGTTSTLDFTLGVAGQSERINVTSAIPPIDPQQTAVSTVISRDQIEALPINGRNFISFSVIAPGVSTDQTPQQGASATSGLTFAGQRGRSNNITVDGLDNNDPTIGSVRATFSQEAVYEFQVLTNSYSAEFGKASGGVVNIVTKSGTNTTAGRAFFYGRDEALNARNHFEEFDPDGSRIDREKAPYRQKQFGGILGGPIVRDRSFYFASFERLDVTASNFVNIDDKTPVFLLTGVPIGTPLDIIRNAGFAVEEGNVPYDVTSDALLLKVDHQLRPTQSLSLRYTYGDALNQNIEPFGGQVSRSRAAVLDSSDHMFAASHVAVLRDGLANDLRFQFARRDQTVRSLDPTCSGICDLIDEGGPTVEITGVASVGRQRFTPQDRLNDRYQVIDSITFNRGTRHTLRAGVDFNYIDQKKQALPLHFGGRYIFAPFTPAQSQALGLPPIAISAIQAFALGIPARYVQGYGDPAQPYGYSDLSLFVQDDIRLTDRLTVKAGLRYQRQFWPDFDYSIAGYPTSYGYPNDGNDIAPRVAAAWSDTRNTVRAAYGMFYDNQITGMAGIARVINGTDKVQTLVVGPPTSVNAWRVSGRKLPRIAVPPVFPSLVIAIDPGLETPYAHQFSTGYDRELPNQMALSASVVYVHGFNQPGTIDYNPLVPSLGPGRRPEDVGGIPNTSAPILQYTSFGETWYKGLTLSLSRRFNNRYQFLVSYTLSKAEDNSIDFQSAFLPQNNGAGRDRGNLNGLPVGFRPDDERGPSLQDQRHRFVASGMYALPANFQVSTILTIGSGRPYNILAGADLNGDGDGGAFPSDRARSNPLDPATSVTRDAGTLPAQATMDVRVMRRFDVGRVKIDGIFEVFNLFNRTNYTDINNVFGPGAFPNTPLATYGQFTQAGPPLQIQLAARVSF